jgi:pimeloyl-ACP methyl ester carboxylesterase
MERKTPFFPDEHGLALSRTIPNAKLLTLNGTGHELHRDDWDAMVNAILRHTDARKLQSHKS